MPFSSKLLQMGAAGAGEKLYVENVFSTYLYTGTGSNQTITNNIDLSGEGGLVWVKGRSAGYSHGLFDTLRGADYWLNSASTDASTSISGIPANPWITGFNSDGFGIGTNGSTNNNGTTYTTWTFRKAKKFFDVVTYTGNGTNKTVSHNLGSVPGCIIVKRTDTSSGDGWMVYHRSNTANPETDYLLLNSTAATADEVVWNDTAPTSTVFSVGPVADVNANGGTYVAYLFAHDAGGFGDAGSDSIIKCGSYTGIGASSGPEIDLGWEPQWLLIKAAESANNWLLFDNMRGMNVIPSDDNVKQLFANTNGAEANAQRIIPTATGFKVTINDSILNSNGATYIYIAIRRGPMKTPTSGTEVFYPKVHAGTSSYSVGFPTDLCLAADQSGNSLNTVAVYRLAGNNAYFGGTASTAAEVSVSVCQFDLQNSFQLSYNNNNQARWHFRRAPGFFDVVCYTGDGASSRSITHNLGVKPEFIIVKRRSSTGYWATGHGTSGLLFALNTTNAGTSSTSTAGVSANGYVWIDDGTTTTFKVIAGDTDSTAVNASGSTYVAYLFASVSGVSKVGTYTGNGSSVTVTTDFQPRFILVKRTDSTGNWIVSDSARGLVSGSDPYLLLNSTAAEDTDEDWVDVSSTGFTVNETSAANANVNTATYIYLAIA